jgi:transposase-like protein
VIIVLEADADLVAGALTCPRCAASLRPWSWAPVRCVRQRVRPRRARCTGCQATQVLLPAACLPRRADAIEVIRAMLLAHAHGQGHRTIARDLDRPATTVSRWLRAARGDHIEWLRRHGVERAFHLDQDVLAEVGAQATALGDALCALAAAVAWRRRFARHAEAWTLIGAFTAGRLLAPS